MVRQKINLYHVNWNDLLMQSNTPELGLLFGSVCILLLDALVQYKLSPRNGLTEEQCFM